jgi:hypothetical protein
MSRHRNAIVLLAGLLAVAGDAGARGGRGGGGRGGGGFRGGGGGARTSATRSGGSYSRPSGGGTRTAPSGGGTRTGGNYAARTSPNATRTGQTANRDVNRNVNRNVNRDVNVDGDRGYYAGGRYYGGYPVARAAAVTAGVALTAAAVGSIAYSLPSGCSPYYGYYACGGVYYQPQYQGDNVTYVVVNAPEGAPAEGSAAGSAQPPPP